jgi:hypothetical protein
MFDYVKQSWSATDGDANAAAQAKIFKSTTFRHGAVWAMTAPKIY